MPDPSLTRLDTARRAYNAFVDAVVEPRLHERGADADQMTHAQIAATIDDKDLRRQYIGLAIELVEANIAEYGQAARLRMLPTRQSQVWPVMFAVVAAAIGYQMWGKAAAVLVAALAYYFVRRHGQRSHAAEADEVQRHNDGVAGWAATIADWQTDLRELSEVER